jgi:Ca2+ transporting ATPase
VSSLCNDSNIEYKDSEFGKIGQSTEAALKVLVEKLGVPDKQAQSRIDGLPREQRVMACNQYWEESYERLWTLEFNRDRKSMSVLVKDSSAGEEILFVKGAWDPMLARSSHVSLGGGEEVELDDELREALNQKVLSYCTGKNHFRCLAIAHVRDPPDLGTLQSAKPDEFVKFEQNMTLIGVVGILDPPRPEVKPAIEKCHSAGIRVIVITGDNKATATAICRKIGVFGKHEDIEGKAFTGAEFKAMNQVKRLEAVKNARLFARVEPLDKQHLVKCLHAHKKVVAMTGDGVNDAPALKEADIGLAMGSGTAVAKGAAKMVLADDNFTTIVAAIEEGRNIYTNTKQFIRYLICSNIGEVVAIFLCAVSGLPEVLLPVQLLWVNLVTDGLPAIALGFNAPEQGIMNQPPRPHDEPIVSGATFVRYMVTGLYIGLATVAGMVWWYCWYEDGPHLTFSQLFEWNKCTADSAIDCSVFKDNSPMTMSLSVLVTIEMFTALNSLSELNSILSPYQHPGTNPYLLAAMSLSFGLHFVILYVPFLAKIFSVTPLEVEEWIAVIALATPVIILDEVMKFILRNSASKKTKS